MKDMLMRALSLFIIAIVLVVLGALAIVGCPS
jgi:hypothetical protein